MSARPCGSFSSPAYVDLSEMATVGDLQGGIEEAERLLADRAIPAPARETSPENQR